MKSTPHRARPLGAALVLAVLLLAAAGCGDGETPEDALRDAAPGDCLAAPEDLDDDYEVVACDEAADYEVLLTVDERLPDDPTGETPTPCDGEQAYDYGLSLTQGDPFSLCLQQLPQEGDCVYQGRYIACEDGGGDVVAAVLPDTTDPAACPSPGARGRVYEEDEVVVCLSANAP
ncbi:hypothetical protein HC251_22890 [Iamia sp. SCSIO 61187]|uniref:LppU/SCO3897 family protein n=1 Tax=Iamia sp. SCSIO 61187 TaxID=2722752 RepID=UPI001C629A6D|nr:hypothetical protein [Iamia sp. SCSIO 61187]QYG94996.1 hypothetical protein HC251_22890 [Iamia sp. SCSIO 61187]